METTSNRHSHWIVKAPPGITLEWDAHITEDRPDHLIAWETLPDNVITAQQIKEEIRRFKHILEAGELPTSEQP